MSITRTQLEAATEALRARAEVRPSRGRGAARILPRAPRARQRATGRSSPTRSTACCAASAPWTTSCRTARRGACCWLIWRDAAGISVRELAAATSRTSSRGWRGSRREPLDGLAARGARRAAGLDRRTARSRLPEPEIARARPRAERARAARPARQHAARRARGSAARARRRAASTASRRPTRRSACASRAGPRSTATRCS